MASTSKPKVDDVKDFYVTNGLGGLRNLCSFKSKPNLSYPIKTLGTFIGQNLTANMDTPGSKCYLELKNPIELIDIDTEGDLTVMKKVIKRDLYDFGFKLP